MAVPFYKFDAVLNYLNQYYSILIKDTARIEVTRRGFSPNE